MVGYGAVYGRRGSRVGWMVVCRVVGVGRGGYKC